MAHDHGTDTSRNSFPDQTENTHCKNFFKERKRLLRWLLMHSRNVEWFETLRCSSSWAAMSTIYFKLAHGDRNVTTRALPTEPHTKKTKDHTTPLPPQKAQVLAGDTIVDT